jgi:ABC-type polysaccharide/polyol phosphate export permease
MPTKVSGYPKIIFFYAALVPWTFFSTSINYAIPSLASQYNLITKIYFPREIIPISRICVALVDFLMASVLYVIFAIFYQIHITWNILWFFPLMIQLIVFTISVSLMLSALNVFYRDVEVASGFVMRLWFFATPIFYSIDKLSIKLKLLLFLNPLTFIIENMRRCILEGRGIIAWQFLIVSLLLVIYLFLSIKFFNITERRFADVI